MKRFRYILLLISISLTVITLEARIDTVKAEEIVAVATEALNPLDEAKNTLQAKINQKNKEIADLEAEIKGFKAEIQKTTGQTKTLQGALNSLELTRKKLTADISVTAKKIDAATLSIESLGGQINDKQEAISVQQDGLRATLKQTNEADALSLVEIFLENNTLSDVWNSQNTLRELRDNMREKTNLLLSIKTDLTNTKISTEKKQRELLSLRMQLADQKKIVEVNKSQTTALLNETKNKESNYKKLLTDREAKRLAFEKELNDYESQLKLIIDPNSFPGVSKVLRPPLDELLVTQLFGDTDFARTHPGAYSGKGHNGVDFRATIGTKVYAALAGIIQATGDTDTVCPNASYGRWVLIKHGNGLSTIYAHLSLIKASVGQVVETGDLIGYSGNTGYTTGPHLHFTLYASQGLRLVNLPSKVCRGTYYVPVADLKAYLNPMLYL
ncbi:MAG: peptidoglycan DD-metalloendopeptidase family protein [bacterium]|nr:peptidoglycan DD-metalloendopeptidase family protein [bacterium]